MIENKVRLIRGRKLTKCQEETSHAYPVRHHNGSCSCSRSLVDFSNSRKQSNSISMDPVAMMTTTTNLPVDPRVRSRHSFSARRSALQLSNPFQWIVRANRRPVAFSSSHGNLCQLDFGPTRFLWSVYQQYSIRYQCF